MNTASGCTRPRRRRSWPVAGRLPRRADPARLRGACSTASSPHVRFRALVPPGPVRSWTRRARRVAGSAAGSAAPTTFEVVDASIGTDRRPALPALAGPDAAGRRTRPASSSSTCSRRGDGPDRRRSTCCAPASTPRPRSSLMTPQGRDQPDHRAGGPGEGHRRAARRRRRGRAGRETLMFLTKEAVRLATHGVAVGVACDGCPPLAELLKRYAAAGGRFLVCPICFNARATGRRPAARQRRARRHRAAVGVDR